MKAAGKKLKRWLCAALVTALLPAMPVAAFAQGSGAASTDLGGYSITAIERPAGSDDPTEYTITSMESNSGALGLGLAAEHENGTNSAPASLTGGSGKVRVGYFYLEDYLLGAAEGAPKSGLAYDILCELAAITGWEIEFVYGDFDGLYGMLKDGKIDLLPCVSYNDERAAEVLFPDEGISEERYFISTFAETAPNTSVSDLNGKRLITVRGTIQNTIFETWAKAKGISMEMVYAESFADTWNMLARREGEYILNLDNSIPTADYTSLFRVGSCTSYIAASPRRTDLVFAMNRAFTKLKEINPFILSGLQQKYLSLSLASMTLSQEELDWLAERDTVRVAGFANDPPYAFTDEEGNVTGLYPELLKRIFGELAEGVRVEWQLYSSLQKMETALSEGEVDLVCPEYHNYYTAQKKGMILSDVIEEGNMGLLRLPHKSGSEIKIVATSGTNLDFYYLRDQFPGMSILPCKSVAECVQAVAIGKADAAVAHPTALKNAARRHVRSFETSILSAGCPSCFAAGTKNAPVIQIINRGLHLIDGEKFASMEMNFSEGSRTTLLELILDNKLSAALSLLFLLLLVGFAVNRTYTSRRLRKDIAEIFRSKRLLEMKERELVKANEEANAANDAKSRFLFNMSHDIRTPMNAIIGFNNMALSHLDDREKVEDCLNKANTSSRMLLQLINDVLDMARIETGNIRCEYSTVSLTELMGHIAEMTRRSLSKDLQIISDFSFIKNDWVSADELHLSRIITNILSNAVKYTPEGGTVKFTVVENPSVHEGCRSYDFLIEDNGIGMSPQYLEHIYEEFSREKNTTLSGVQGTGLGMAITKQLVDLLGGTISVSSRLGEGTGVLVHFNLKTQKPPEKAADATAGRDLSCLQGKRVLLVEDNELNYEIAEELLEDYGLKVIPAANGEIAVNICRNAAEAGPEHYHRLIFMDIQMPVMDGYEATQHIREIETADGYRVPIVAMTANAFPEDRKMAQMVGMDDFLIKPIEKEELERVLLQFIKD